VVTITEMPRPNRQPHDHDPRATIRAVPKFKPDLARLHDTAQELFDQHHMPGLGVGIVMDGELAHTDCFGFADIAKAKPYTPDSRHRIGSITKTMVSLCAMALVDEERLALNSKVALLLPDIELKGYGDDLTVWHLLTHTGGIGEAPNPEDLKKPFDFLFADTDCDTPLADLYAEGITIEAQPGTKYAYANHGFALLGEIVSRIENASLPEVTERRVFGPLGMTATDLNDEPHPDLAHGYSQAPTPQDRALLDMLGVQFESDDPVDGHNIPGAFVRVWGNGGAGAVQSTVTDMGRYAFTLLRASHGIVRPETFAAMTADHWRPDKRLPGWGLGFSVRGEGRARHFGHGGSVFGGWNSYLAVYPELDAAVILHVNMYSDSFDRTFVPFMLNTFLGGEDVPAAAQPFDPRILAAAPGVFELPMPGPLTNFRPQYNCGRVQISNQDGKLMLHSRRGAWKNGARLVPVRAGEPDFFAIEIESGATNYMSMIIDETGAVTGLRFQQLCEMHRNPEFEPWS
jgi:CubicO group peptidase (beta-lactamase class C family)